MSDITFNYFTLTLNIYFNCLSAVGHTGGPCHNSTICIVCSYLSFQKTPIDHENSKEVQEWKFSSYGCHINNRRFIQFARKKNSALKQLNVTLKKMKGPLKESESDRESESGNISRSYGLRSAKRYLKGTWPLFFDLLDSKLNPFIFVLYRSP